MSLLLIFFLTQWLCTALMTGIIWMVQVVHYPLMNAVGQEAFITYAIKHQTAITFLVGPLMLLEVAAALACLYLAESLLPSWLFWVGLALLMLIWASTAFLQVPCHEVLRHGYDATTVQRLVDTNWIRTLGWTLRLVLLTYGLLLVFKPFKPYKPV
jgi:hypothetical protein